MEPPASSAQQTAPLEPLSLWGGNPVESLCAGPKRNRAAACAHKRADVGFWELTESHPLDESVTDFDPYATSAGPLSYLRSNHTRPGLGPGPNEQPAAAITIVYRLYGER